MATVLALDKDPLQLELLSFLLKQEAHRVHVTPDPDIAIDILQAKMIDLVILETALPRIDGFRLCQQIRQLNPYTPVIIVSERTDEDQIVRSLQSAADDYITKPFSPRQLLARVQAVLRRSSLVRTGSWRDENIAIGELALNLQHMQVVVNGRPIALTPRELSLLHALMNNANRVLSRDQLMNQAWGDHFVGTPKTVDVCIQRLRRKIQPHVTHGNYLQSLRGFGYKFEIPRPERAAAFN